MGDPIQIARAKLARAVRARDAEAEELARHELTEAHLEKMVGVLLERDHKPRLEAIERACARLRAEATA